MLEHNRLLKFDDNSYVHFVTTGTFRNLPFFRNEECCRALLEELNYYSDKLDFTLAGYVIMPDHIHLLLWWDKTEKSDLSISRIIQAIKGTTARRIINLETSGSVEHLLRVASDSAPKNYKPHKQNIKYHLWKRGFYDLNIYTDEKLAEKLNYVHSNPVRAGLVSSPGDYKWSSYKHYSDNPVPEETVNSNGITRGADAPRYPSESINIIVINHG